MVKIFQSRGKEREILIKGVKNIYSRGISGQKYSLKSGGEEISFHAAIQIPDLFIISKHANLTQSLNVLSSSSSLFCVHIPC